MSLYLGLMSGTSMDGIDSVLLDIDAARMQLRSAMTRDWPATLQRRLRRANGSSPSLVRVCGGGAFNSDLMARLGRCLPSAKVDTTAARGIAPEHVEAAGFAWLAHCYLCGLPGNLPSVTGAQHLAPLGALYRGALV